ncbi:hypothetical protein BO70DRAFT_50389 [Aspergillus heteromorphus CBS 117.55]|uniref:NTF2-domain-containing protein n=1 Tax=Aspergillus heteromorphus CBS 117.55 TaxID=1448321 RepID=A0A317W2R4_9EURO|nr:uncharacterized protein BO70DRAFT_50389 [Aspergillus heteromorphus CBS 117.55]PWY79562.1 hypothetical protein BO70DRAFT_50389 [Aspergillus heteromorphus CBS 117.55]
MADTTQAPINGGYPAQHAYPDSYNHASVNSAASFQPAPSSTPSNAPSNDQKNGISKDEVGWYFVEQYYTNMSRSPEKLNLFYSRRSQLVFGTEAESVQVAVGQKAINDKIKQLDFQDCKVRVLNVDSQASFDNILISVIGEISNRSEPSRKFVQTFVLAEQPNGYYVLNDIFRYLADEEEEIETEEAAPAPAPAAPADASVPEVPAQPEAETAPEAVETQVDSEPAVAQVDEKLEEAEKGAEEVPATESAPQTNGDSVQEAPAEAAPEAAAPAESDDLKVEEPAAPEPTPVPEQKEAPAPAKESAPARAVPKTWATIASKSGATVPVVPALPVTPVKPTAPAAPAPVASSTQSTATPPPVTTESVPSQPPSNDGSGWQTAGHEHKKTQSRAGEEQNVLGYIKNVTEKVDAVLLKQTLSRFGKLKHFDVSRQKNCAFVEYGDAAAYNAAVAANPHQIGTEQIYVEERRPRANAFGNGNYGAGRGGAGRGRGDRAGSQGRGGFQREGRGGFAPRGRGGNVNAKGRNQTQTA